VSLQFPPDAPTPTNSCSPGVTGTLAEIDAPRPPAAPAHDPPAPPIAVTVTLLTPAGTVKTYCPAELYVVVVVTTAEATAGNARTTLVANTPRAPRHARPPIRHRNR
jgi:hypothetical protein